MWWPSLFAGCLTISWRKYKVYVKCIIHKDGTFIWFLSIQGRYMHETMDQSHKIDTDALNWRVRLRIIALGLANFLHIPCLNVRSKCLLESNTRGELMCSSVDSLVQSFSMWCTLWKNNVYSSCWLDFSLHMHGSLALYEIP